MDQIEESLQRIFISAIDPLRLILLSGTDDSHDFTCIFSNTDNYTVGEKKSLYDIPPLLRILVSKADVLTPELINKIYKRAEKKLCFILDWNEHSRKVFIFNLDNLNTFNHEQLTEICDDRRQELFQAFRKAYYRTTEQK